MSAPDSFNVLQGASDPSYHRPPLDGSLTLPELYVHQAQHNPERTVFAYADGSNSTRTLSYRVVTTAMDRGARAVIDCLDTLHAGRNQRATNNPPPTIGILALTGKSVRI